MKKSRSNSDYTTKIGTTDGPLGDYPEKFLNYLRAEHYSKKSIHDYTKHLNFLNRQMRKHGVDTMDLDEDRACDLVTGLSRPSSRRKDILFSVRHFIRFLNSSGAGKPVPPIEPDNTPMGCLRREYEEYLRRERGLSERTIEHCWGFAARFLKFRFGDKEGDLSQITATDIVRFMQQLISRKKPFRDKTPPTHLRNFFRYLFRSGKTTANLALCVPWIKQQSDARVPRHLDAGQVETILRAIRVDSPIGRRNYAIMLLLARLGLRAPEVIAMQIDDVDWRAGEIIVRGKGQTQDRLPLPQDVGEALAEYLQRDRVGNSRALFVVSRAPHRPLRDGAMLNVILKRAFAQTGLTPPAPFVGSHVLRHSLAVALARNGASLDEIGDLLRHQYRASTMIYARLDIEGLRSIAQPWPAAGGAR
jgi:integrase/recombinase XerD